MSRWLAILLAGCVTSLARAEEQPVPGSVDAAVKRGIGFLLSQQDVDGAFSDSSKRQNVNALTGLAVLAMTAVGHQTTDVSPEGKAVRRGLEFLLSTERQDGDGYYGKSDGSRMYGHGIVTLALAELIGMGVDARQDALIRQRCQKAISLIVRSQKVQKQGRQFEGGWRYSPEAGDADLSVTVWQVMALRAAKNAGLVVPKETIDDAIGYIKRSYIGEHDRDGRPTNLKSAFGYQPGRGPTYSTASAGLLALQVSGDYDAPELTGTTAWLQQEKPKADQIWFYYGTYYYAQGMYQRGGESAAIARRNVEEILLAHQNKDGSWLGSGSENQSKVYCTSLALLSLSVRYHFMPIYQR